jgi:hypothetical protein
MSWFTRITKGFDPSEPRNENGEWSSDGASVKDQVYTVLLDATDAGPFDGGCVLAAQALQKVVGGDIYALVNKDDRAQHAVVKKGSAFYDFSGKKSQQAMLADFNRYEAMGEHQTAVGVRPLRADDLMNSPRNDQLAEKIAKLMGGKFNKAVLSPYSDEE